MTGPTALITGGTSGIGLATARVLHGRGFRVMVTGRSAESTALARRDLPGDVAVVAADSASLAATDRLVAEVRERFGGLTALFLNAGVSRNLPLETVDEASFDEIFAVNTKGQFFTLQKMLPLLSDGASVVITVGAGVRRGRAGAAVTAGSRGALLSMIPSLVAELAPHRIRVNAVSPGAVDTPIWGRSGAAPETVDAMKQQLATSIPLGRLGEAHEVAAVAAFLLGEDASYVTGQDIVVGGGL